MIRPILLVLVPLSLAASFDPLPFINPLIGSLNGGNVFAGATLPYGLAKASADVTGANTGGFSPDGSPVNGFSSLHDSGTGGNPSLGNFPLFPQYCADDDLGNCQFRREDRAVPYVNGSVTARPGYFGLTLANGGIQVDMTVTRKTALYRFVFPESNGINGGQGLHPLVMVDLTDLWQSRQNASISVDASRGRITGNATFLPSFGAGTYRAYFCVDISGGEVFDSGVYVNSRAGTEPQELFVTRGFNLFYLQAGGFLRLQRPADGVVTARMGMSFVSNEQACANAEEEIPGPAPYDFDGIRKQAEDEWREKLSVVQVAPGGVSQDLQETFWTALYRTMISPQNYTGENPLWESDKPYFDSYYCIWDTFRALHPLLTVIDPPSQTEMLQSLLDIYTHTGWLPDCRMSLCKGWTQGGSNADVLFADAYIKNVSGIDWNLAYEAVVNDAENEPLDWSNEGRGGLQSWKRLGYIPYLDYDYLGFGTNSRSISRTLEYAYDDFSVATLAKALGKEDDATKYLQRSGNWRNLFKEDQRSSINGTDSGFQGFFQPKFLNGTWGYQDPIACSPLADFCSLTSNPSETFESSVWEYQFYVPHSISSLITLLGGTASFLARLSYAFTSGLLDITNEPVFLTVFLPHYAARPALSTDRVHSYIPSSFNSSLSGLPGNDDSGTMAAFLIWCMLGLFPNPGQDIYLISAPFFQSVNVTSKITGRTATVSVVDGWDPEFESRYVQSARLDGEVYNRSWIGHAFFTEGGRLELVLGREEGGWGTGEEDVPPSPVGEAVV